MLLVFCFGLGLYAIYGSIAPAIMSELFPTELGVPGHRYLVQPHRRGIRRHRPAGDPVAQQHRPQQLVLLYVAAGAAVAFVATLTLPETKGRC